MSKHNELGKKGEEIASNFLRSKGHKIIETNYHYDHKEIDIISLEADIIVFSEIKTRSSLLFGFPEEAVTPEKQSFIKTAASYFLESHTEYKKCRFDVISIIINQNNIKEIKHFEDVFF